MGVIWLFTYAKPFLKKKILLQQVSPDENVSNLISVEL